MLQETESMTSAPPDVVVAPCHARSLSTESFTENIVAQWQKVTGGKVDDEGNPVIPPEPDERSTTENEERSRRVTLATQAKDFDDSFHIRTRDDELKLMEWRSDFLHNASQVPGGLMEIAFVSGTTKFLRTVLALGFDPDTPVIDADDNVRILPSHRCGGRDAFGFQGVPNVEAAKVLSLCRPNLGAMDNLTPREVALKCHDASNNEERTEGASASRSTGVGNCFYCGREGPDGKIQQCDFMQVHDIWNWVEQNGFSNVAELAANGHWWAVKNLCRRRKLDTEELASAKHEGKTTIEYAELHPRNKDTLVAEIEYFLRDAAAAGSAVLDDSGVVTDTFVEQYQSDYYETCSNASTGNGSNDEPQQQSTVTTAAPATPSTTDATADGIVEADGRRQNPPPPTGVSKTNANNNDDDDDDDDVNLVERVRRLEATVAVLTARTARLETLELAVERLSSQMERIFLHKIYLRAAAAPTEDDSTMSADAASSCNSSSSNLSSANEASASNVTAADERPGATLEPASFNTRGHKSQKSGRFTIGKLLSARKDRKNKHS